MMCNKRTSMPKHLSPKEGMQVSNAGPMNIQEANAKCHQQYLTHLNEICFSC